MDCRVKPGNDALVAGAYALATQQPRSEETTMVNIYLFIELVRAASAPDVAEHIKSMTLANCKFANVVVLSSEKLVAQLDCSAPEDGTKVVLEEMPKVEGVVQTNVIAVVKPVHH
jgi:hypothetical protein